MDSKEVIEKLNHIRRYPHDSSASDAIDDLFDEWRRQAERIAEHESEKVRLTTICAALNQDNEKLRTLAHQKVNELIDALDRIAELEKENERLRDEISQQVADWWGEDGGPWVIENES